MYNDNKAVANSCMKTVIIKRPLCNQRQPSCDEVYQIMLGNLPAW